MKTIIIPDVHGRSFWKDAVNGHETENIVFLGDYHDPYGHEYITETSSIENFKEIIEFKKAHPDNVTLLLGNHDCGYMFGKFICSCRYDYLNEKTIKALFKDNYDLFQLAAKTVDCNGKEYWFSHAGISPVWVKFLEIPKPLDENDVDFVNRMYKEKNKYFIDDLAQVSRYRGGSNFWGSMVWADVNEWVNNSDLYVNYKIQPTTAYQIIGHTQLRHNPIVTDFVACLDVRRGFILQDDGVITEMDNTPVEITTFNF